MSLSQNKLLINDPNLKDILEEKKTFNTDLKEKKDILLSTEHKYSLTFPTNINFKVDYDLPLLVQNFLQDSFKIPSFNNMIMLKNETSETDESFRIILSKIPFEIIVAEDHDYFDFIIEKNIEFFTEYVYKNIAGFFLNVEIEPTENTEILTLYRYITPFKVNDNNEIEILKKNIFLKYNPFYILESNPKKIDFKMIFLQGKDISTDDEFIEDLIKKFNLNFTKEQILERIENNNILVKNQEREKNFDSYFSVYNYKDKNNKNNYLCKINFNLYTPLNFNKQKELMKKIFSQILTILKKNITETIFEFNNNTLPINKCILINEDIFMESIKIKKEYNQTYNYYQIKQKYNSLFRYICKKNNVDFGSDLLCIKKNKILNEKKCYEEIDNFKKTILEVIDKAFEHDYKDFYDNKNKLFKS